MRSHSSRENKQYTKNILPQFSESGWVSARHKERSSSSSRNSNSEKDSQLMQFPSHLIDASLKNSRDNKFNQGSTSLKNNEITPSKLDNTIKEGSTRNDLHLNNKMNKKYFSNQQRLKWEELKVHLSAAQSDMLEKKDLSNSQLNLVNGSNITTKKDKNITIIQSPPHKIINLPKNIPSSSKNGNFNNPENVKKQINLDSQLNKSLERYKHKKQNEDSKNIQLSANILDNQRKYKLENKENQKFLEDYEITQKTTGLIQNEESCLRQPSSINVIQKMTKTPPSLQIEQFLQSDIIYDGISNNQYKQSYSDVLTDLSLITNNSHNDCRNSQNISLLDINTTKNIDKNQLKQTIPFRQYRANSHCGQYSNTPRSEYLLSVRPFVNKKLQLPHQQQISLTNTPRASSSCSTTATNRSFQQPQFTLQLRQPHNILSTSNQTKVPFKTSNKQELQFQLPARQQCWQDRQKPKEIQNAELIDKTPNLQYKRSTLPQLIDPLPIHPHFSLQSPVELQNQDDSFPGLKNQPSSLKSSSPPKIPQILKKIRFGIRTQKGQIPSNPLKINQDRVITQQFLGGCEFQHLFGVCDGHGLNGHEVSEFVKNNIVKLSQERSQFVESNPLEAIVGIIGDTNKKLCDESGIEISLSGSTVCVVFFNKKSLFCANVGDSRAILGRKLERKWSVLPLSRDHKPNDEKEATRINNSNGRIAKHVDGYGNESGPERVYLKDQNVPGLAMTRSLGDQIAESVGVIWTPEIIEWKYTDEDSILVVGSDGLFEFMDNKQILRVILPFYESGDLEAGCDALLTQATQYWKQRSSMIDDISFVIVFISK